MTIKLPFHIVHELGCLLMVDPANPTRATLFHHDEWDEVSRNTSFTRIVEELANCTISLEWDTKATSAEQITLHVEVRGLSILAAWRVVARLLEQQLCASVRVVTLTDLLAGAATLDEQSLLQLRDAVNRQLSELSSR